MRIVVHGQQAFGKAVLERLLERDENVVGVFCAPDREGRPADPLKELALERGLPVHQPTSWKTDEALELMRSFEPDLCVMAYVTLLVPQQVLDAPKLGTIQYHPSLLPRHRGPSSINWPIIQGETETGITIFWPDEALDEGPILLQKEGRDRTGRHARQPVLQPAVPDRRRRHDRGDRSGARRGKAPRIEQDHAQATYESWCKKADARDRLEQAGGAGVQSDPRHRPPARRLDPGRRHRGADLRQRARPGIGRAGHGALGRRRQLRGRGRGRLDPGHAGAAAGRQEDGRRRVRARCRGAAPASGWASEIRR